MAQAQFPDDVTPDFPVEEEPPTDEDLREIVESTFASLRVMFPSVKWEIPEIF